MDGRGAIAILLAAALAGCAATDPRTAVLEERAGWRVDVQSFVPTDAGVRAVLGIVAPPRARLDTLTVRVRLYGEADAVLAEHWVPLDVTALRSGAGYEKSVQLDAPHAEILAMEADVVPEPTADEQQHMVELQGLDG